MLSALGASSRALVAWTLTVVLALLCAAPDPSAAARHATPHHKKTHAKSKHHHKKKKKKRKTKRRPPAAAALPVTAPGRLTTPGGTTTTAPAAAGGSQGSSQGGPPPGPAASPLWDGGFETGNFAQWKQLDGNVADRSRYFGLVNDPVADGRWAFRSTVDASATANGEAGQRAIVLLFPSNVASQNTTGAYEGSERWYRTRFYFPADFQPSPNSAWNWIVQWHNWPDGICCANLALSVDATGGGQKLSLRVMGGGDAAHPAENNDLVTERNPAGYLHWFVGDPVLKRDHWYDSLMHVKWSADPSKGYVEWWLDGRRIVATAAPTLYWYADNNRNYAGATPGPGQAYYMEGYYRPSTLPNGSLDTSTESVFFDGARIGASAASVSG